MAGEWLAAAGAPAFGAPGDVGANRDAILERVREAREAGAELLLLPELCLSGGTCGSLFRHGALLDACAEAAEAVAKACGEMLCVFGLPVKAGNGVYDAAAVVSHGDIAAFVVKQSLAPLERLFFPAECAHSVSWRGRQVPCAPARAVAVPKAGNAAALVCFYDDLHNLQGMSLPGGRSITVVSPALHPHTAGRADSLRAEIAALTMSGASLVYAAAGANESTTDQVFSGLAVVASRGEVLAANQPFSYEAVYAGLPGGGGPSSPVRFLAPEPVPPARDTRMPYAPPEGAAREAWCRECVEIAARGLAARMGRVGSRAAALGVSGGLDSALALIVTKRAFDLLGLDPAGIHAVSLPALGSGGRTGRNALRLVAALGLAPREIDLKGSVLKHFRDIGHDEKEYDAVYENAQARERTQVLMDLANKHRGLMVGSGDLSEMALGFATFGGDHISMYGVNAGLYKSAIRLILRQAAADSKDMELQVTLLDILDTPISPELLPGKDGDIAQRTEDIVGPYLLNDFFLHHFLTQSAGPEELLRLARAAFPGEYGADELLRRMRAFFKRFFAGQFKRSCMPDGPQVLDVSLSPRGFFLMPSDAVADAWLEAADRLEARERERKG